MQDPSLELPNPCDVLVKEEGLIEPLRRSSRHSLPKASIEERRKQRLQRFLDSPMMQENDSGWTRQRQRAFIRSRIEAYGGTP